MSDWWSADPVAAPAKADQFWSKDPVDRDWTERLKKIALGAIEPITSYPSTYAEMNRDAREQMSHGIDQIKSGATSAVTPTPEGMSGPQQAEAGPVSLIKGAGNVALGGLGYVASPINAALRTVVGKPFEAVTGIPKEPIEFAASLALPIPKRIPGVGGGPIARAPAAAPASMLDVTLSEGQATRELPTIQREQAALRGTSGVPAQKQAQMFADQQRAELEAARTKISESLDPFNARIAESPQQAGELVSESMQKTAAQRKAGVKSAYDEAKSYPGQIHAAAFEGIAPKIKADLSAGTDPVIIDDKLTPYASAAIQDIENRVANLRIQNRADPFGQPNPENIVGVSLEGVEQMRKRLSAFRKDAYGSGNASDGRATRAVIDAFDKRVDEAVKGGLFEGDPRAVQAWLDARAAHADYRSTFTAGKNDPVGRVVEKILGKNPNAPAIANDVADFMYGSAGVNPSSLNVGVVNRIKTTLGDRSPEWSAVKQGLFERLVSPGEGVTEWGGGKVAQRLNKFLNVDGREMSAMVFSPAERDLMKSYADLMRHIEVPQAGANWSNTATFAAKAFDKIGSNVGMTVAAVIGHYASGVPFVGEAAGAGAAKLAGMGGAAMQARKIAKQMPIISNTMQDFQSAAKAFETSASARNTARLSLAARNLANNLKDTGITISPENLLRAIQGPGPAGAENEKP